MTNKVFTYREASAILEAVRDKTLAASERLETMRAQAEHLGPGQNEKLSEWMDSIVNQWSADMLAIGVLPKGLFTVDFDSGKGYYFCWTLNEPTLSHFHRYEEGFAQRKSLPEEDMEDTPAVLN